MFSWLSYFEKIRGTGRTDGQTDGPAATLNADPLRADPLFVGRTPLGRFP